MMRSNLNLDFDHFQKWLRDNNGIPSSAYSQSARLHFSQKDV